MTAEVNTKRYRLRLTDTYRYFDFAGTHLFRTWSKGEIVTDNADMKLLEAHEAPIERIETDE